MAGTSFKSKSKQKIYKKTPGTNLNIHFRKSNPKSHHCGISGAILNGIPKKTAIRFNKLSKSKKRPNRKYGGTYSHQVVKSRLERTLWQTDIKI
jgi:large subunit ribosomal protein L34e